MPRNKKNAKVIAANNKRRANTAKAPPATTAARETPAPPAAPPVKRPAKAPAEIRIKCARGFRNARVTANPGDVFTADQVGGDNEALYLIAQGLADRVK